MWLGLRTARENDMTDCLVEVPRNRLAWRQRKCLNLDGTRNGIPGTEAAKVITGGGSCGERDVRQCECSPDEYRRESYHHTCCDPSSSRHASPPFESSTRELLRCGVRQSFAKAFPG